MVNIEIESVRKFVQRKEGYQVFFFKADMRVLLMSASALMNLQACEGVQRGDACLDALASQQLWCIFRMLPRRHIPRYVLCAWS